MTCCHRAFYMCGVSARVLRVNDTSADIRHTPDAGVCRAVYSQPRPRVSPHCLGNRLSYVPGMLPHEFCPSNCSPMTPYMHANPSKPFPPPLHVADQVCYRHGFLPLVYTRKNTTRNILIWLYSCPLSS